MVSTIKFSEFTNAGDLTNSDITVGYGSGDNQQYNNPWTFLAPGTTGDRPAISPDIYYRLRFNTTDTSYEYYDPLLATWVQINVSNLFTWNVVLTTPFQMLPSNGYITNSSILIQLRLPTTSLVGQEIAVSGQATGGWQIIQGNLQTVNIGSVSTTIGVGGSITSTNRYDSLRLVCIVANTTWTTVGGPQGNLSIV